LYSFNYEDYSFSDNAGATWTKINDNRALFHSSAIDPFNPSRMLTVTGSTIPSTLDGFVLNGTTRIASGTPFSYTNKLIPHPTQQGFWFGGTSGQFSTNGGVTWTSSSVKAVNAIDATGRAWRFDTQSPHVKIQSSTTITATTPTWTDVAEFTLIPRGADPEIRTEGTSVGVLSNSRLLLSRDGGTTFSELVVAEPTLSPRSPAVAARGNALYVLDYDRVRRSTDEGATFTASPLIALESHYRTSGKLQMNPDNVNNVYLHIDNSNSMYVQDIYFTNDAFETTLKQSGSSTGWYSWASVSGLSKADPRIFMSLGWGRASRTTNGLTTVTHKPISGAPSNWFVWYPSAEAHVSPWNSDEMFYVESNTGILWKFNWSDETNVNMAAALPFQDVAAVDLAKLDASSYELRILSRTGRIAFSTNGTTFTLRTQGNPLEPTSEMLVRHSLSNPNLIAIGRVRNNLGYLSSDGGITWRGFQPGCPQRDFAFSNTRLWIACQDERVRWLEH